MSISLSARYQGCLLGLACGDAVGTAVEFRSRDSFAPVTGMCGGGPFDLAPGQWTDDTSMALCLAESLCTMGGFDARDQMSRYANWWKCGYWSSTGSCFDIGITVRRALERFLETGEAFAGSTNPDTAGNGSLMRLAPIALAYHPRRSQVVRYSGESSRTTHAAPEAIECCELLGYMLSLALDGHPKDVVLQAEGLTLREPKVIAIARGSYRAKHRGEINGTGYCVESIEAALWAFNSTATFESAVLQATNLGDDADTTAAIVGQLAGAFYGLDEIPSAWLEKLAMREEIVRLARSLHTLATAHQ